MPPEKTLSTQRPNNHPTLYESPIITLSIGRKENNPIRFYVHKDRLLHIPYFAAALRDNAFIEGEQQAISFEEEDANIFRYAVEFIYEGDCFPRWAQPLQDPLSLEVQLRVERTTANSIPKDYTPNLSFGMSSGAYITTTETHELLCTLIQLLCLADRYGIEDLVNLCLQKLKASPIGAKEVMVLAQHIVGSIPDIRVDVHKFLKEQVSLHRPRLNECPEFESLLESEVSLLGKGIIRLLINTPTLAEIHYLVHAVKEGKIIGLCIAEVTVDGCIETYGTDDSYGVQFGAAKVGEVVITEGLMDKRKIFCARREQAGPSLAFPGDSFIFMNKAALQQVDM